MMNKDELGSLCPSVYKAIDIHSRICDIDKAFIQTFLLLQIEIDGDRDRKSCGGNQSSSWCHSVAGIQKVIPFL